MPKLDANIVVDGIEYQLTKQTKTTILNCIAPFKNTGVKVEAEKELVAEVFTVKQLTAMLKEAKKAAKNN